MDINRLGRFAYLGSISSQEITLRGLQSVLSKPSFDVHFSVSAGPFLTLLVDNLDLWVKYKQPIFIT